MKSFLIFSLTLFSVSAFSKVVVECPLKNRKGEGFRTVYLYSPTPEKENMLPMTDPAKKTWSVKGKKLQAACFYGMNQVPSYIEDAVPPSTTCTQLEQRKGSKDYNLVDCI